MGDSTSLIEWASEFIPNPDRLFLRVNVRQLTDGELHPGVFNEHGGGMSTDWEKYSTAEESRQRATRPELVGIVALIAGGVRGIEELDVSHTPDTTTNNRAHTDVLGIESKHGFPPEVRKVKIRLQLFHQFNAWLLPPLA